MQLQSETEGQRRIQVSKADVTEQASFESATDQSVDGVVRGVKLLGLRSRNRRNYDTPGVRKTAVEHLSGARIFIDHPETPVSPRSYRDAFGVVENCQYVSGKGFYGDIRYNPKHFLADQFIWDVKNNPSGLGMSVNARLIYGPKKDKNGDEVVESIEMVRSLDVVTKPATSAGIFEHEEESVMDLSTLKEKHADIVEQIASEERAKFAKSSETSEVEKAMAELQMRLKDATEQLAEVKKAEEARKLRDAIEAEYAELVPDADLRKSVVECACELAEDSRKKFKGVVEKMAAEQESAADNDDDDDSEGSEEEEVDADEQENSAASRIRPSRKAMVVAGVHKSLRDILNIKKG